MRLHQCAQRAKRCAMMQPRRRFASASGSQIARACAPCAIRFVGSRMERANVRFPRRCNDE
eukprot:3102454-Lingulodinium_polyedra.AAC.1